MFRWIFATVLFIGLGIIAYSFRLPYYTNQFAKEKLDSRASVDQIGRSDFKKHYYEQLDKLKTNKTALIDLGSGLAIASFCILIFLFFYKVKSFYDLTKIKSINKTTIFISAPLIWLLMFPGTVWYYSYRLERGDYPWFSDSIGIPIMENTFAIVAGLVVLIIFLIIAAWKNKFPVYLLIKPNSYPPQIILVEIFWGLLFVFNLLCFISFVMGGDHISIPINLFFAYLILVLRAGQINSYNIRFAEAETD